MDKSFDHLTDKQLLALCIYGEARGETAEGKIAVGSVILERVKRGGWYGHNIFEVILKPYQFSCFLAKDPNYPKLVHIAEMWDFEMAQNAALNDCYTVADGLLDGRIEPNVKATHYKTLNCVASWADKMKLVATVGHHDFFD